MPSVTPQTSPPISQIREMPAGDKVIGFYLLTPEGHGGNYDNCADDGRIPGASRSGGGTVASTCGCPNGTCGAGETWRNCPEDCLGRCGDGICDPSENHTSCAADCTLTTCGNGACDGGETCTTCPIDCGACAACNNNGTCDANETHWSCPNDCHAANTCYFGHIYFTEVDLNNDGEYVHFLVYSSAASKNCPSFAKLIQKVSRLVSAMNGT